MIVLDANKNECEECQATGWKPNGIPCESCDGTGIGEAPPATFENLTQRITTLLSWIKSAECELAECTKYKRRMSFELKQSYSSNFACHYIAPSNVIFDDTDRLSKYWIRCVKQNIKMAKKMVADTKLHLIEVLDDA